MSDHAIVFFSHDRVFAHLVSIDHPVGINQDTIPQRQPGNVPERSILVNGDREMPCQDNILPGALSGYFSQPGDVLVIATGEHLAHSTWGDLTSRVGAGRGLAAMVTDGFGAPPLMMVK